jgi:serine phosphatase RsbU (regulator of sigma subunit)
MRFLPNSRAYFYLRTGIKNNMSEPSDGRLTEKEQLNIINTVAVAVAQSIELDKVLSIALEKVMEAFHVQNGCIYLYDSDTGRLKVAVSRGLTKEFMKAKSDLPLGSGCAGWAFDKGELFAAFGTPEAGYICADAEQLMGLDCLLASPIMTKTGAQGVIELFAPTSRRLTGTEASLIKVIGDQVAIAVEHARLYEESRQNVDKLTELQKKLAESNRLLTARLGREARVAKMLQKGLLPRTLPHLPGIRIAARLVSATEAADIGGDFYDFIECDRGRSAIVVGDACGSGIEAATLTGITKSTIRAFSIQKPETSYIMSWSNRVLYQQADPSKFVAIFLGLLDPETRELEYCVAGQPSPLIYRRGRILELEPGSLPLAVDLDESYKTNNIKLEPGDTLVMFTDGLIEARRGRRLFGTDSVKEFIKANGEMNLNDLVKELLSASKEFGGGRFRDDVALIAMRFKE